MESSSLIKSAVLGLSVVVSASVSAMECSEVVWQPQVLSKYPNIANYCQSVTEMNGKQYVELDAKFISVHSGKAHVKFKDREGGYGSTFVTGELPDNFKVVIDGEATSLRHVQRDTMLNIYMPADRFVVLADPGSPYDSVDLAMASYDDMLPATASRVPQWGLLGIIACGMGLFLTLARRYSGKDE